VTAPRLIEEGLVEELRRQMATREQKGHTPAFSLNTEQIVQLQNAITDCEFLHVLKSLNPDISDNHWPMLVRRLGQRVAADQSDLFAGSDAKIMMQTYFEHLDQIQRKRDEIDKEAESSWLIPESILNDLYDCRRFEHAAYLFPHSLRYLVKAMNSPDFQPGYKKGSDEDEYVRRMLELFTKTLSVEGQMSLRNQALGKFVDLVVIPMQNLISLRKSTPGTITDDMVAKVCKAIRENRGCSDIALAGHVINALSAELTASHRR